MSGRTPRRSKSWRRHDVLPARPVASRRMAGVSGAGVGRAVLELAVGASAHARSARPARSAPDALEGADPFGRAAREACRLTERRRDRPRGGPSRPGRPAAAHVPDRRGSRTRSPVRATTRPSATRLSTSVLATDAAVRSSAVAPAADGQRSTQSGHHRSQRLAVVVNKSVSTCPRAWMRPTSVTSQVPRAQREASILRRLHPGEAGGGGPARPAHRRRPPRSRPRRGRRAPRRMRPPRDAPTWWAIEEPVTTTRDP